MNKLKIGLLGVGHLGKIHLKCMLATSCWELAGFYDPDEKNAASALAQYPDLRRFSSLKDLLREVDAVDIVTPTLTHYTLATQAIRAGKHVFLEKPVTETVSEGRRLLQLAEKQ
ncbi:MAG TPA: Gfo/Idh/MocA family oxidoreductase, partial [Saprospiraceae bacterium]|nr:Gfo/Idh/MocA family oxidoreductase [Saprospiraceae bacterium]